MGEALPDAPKDSRDLACNLITGTLGAVGKKFSEKPRTAGEIEAYANAMSDMFCAYLSSLTQPRSLTAAIPLA